MTDREYELAEIEEFAEAIPAFAYPDSNANKFGYIEANGLYCVRCGGKRLMRIVCRLWEGTANEGRAEFETNHTSYPGTPGLFSAVCMNCKLEHDVLVHLGPDGPELAIFSPERGGFSTPHSPDNVKYYLDQAHRAESVGATSAAVTMYRSAAEMLLFEQGYTDGMLKKKIQDLLADAKAPAWRDQITGYLNVLRRLGNAATHPGDGDTTKQQALDRKLLLAVRAGFEKLLNLVYEQPANAAAHQATLEAAAQSFQAIP